MTLLTLKGFFKSIRNLLTKNTVNVIKEKVTDHAIDKIMKSVDHEVNDFINKYHGQPLAVVKSKWARNSKRLRDQIDSLI